jgi:hypothetical protein
MRNKSNNGLDFHVDNMKKKTSILLDVDFIGDQNQPITPEEKAMISAYLRSQKGKAAKKKATALAP